MMHSPHTASVSGRSVLLPLTQQRQSGPLKFLIQIQLKVGWRTTTRIPHLVAVPLSCQSFLHSLLKSSEMSFWIEQRRMQQEWWVHLSPIRKNMCSYICEWHQYSGNIEYKKLQEFKQQSVNKGFQ